MEPLPRHDLVDRAPATTPTTASSCASGRPVRRAGFATLSAANIDATKAAIQRYTEIVQAGRLAARCPDVQMQAGSNGPAVGVLRARLTISGDLQGASRPSRDHFDSYLEKAVKRFQASNGLSPTGVVDKRTIAALNIPAQSRLKQLQANLPRLQELQRGAPKKYIFVNIPAAQIEAIENGAVDLAPRRRRRQDRPADADPASRPCTS